MQKINLDGCEIYSPSKDEVRRSIREHEAKLVTAEYEAARATKPENPISGMVATGLGSMLISAQAFA